METSAKNATNVEQAFMAMAASIKNRFVLTGPKFLSFCVFKSGFKALPQKNKAKRNKSNHLKFYEY